MRLLAAIAARHLLARKRQSLVSLVGIILGVAFFLGISSLMQGSEKDFIRRLVDNSPHITISDSYRNARPQPAYEAYPNAAVGISHVKPLNETRGIRHYEQVLESLRARPGLLASPVMAGQVLVSSAGQDMGITLSGMIPDEVRDVSTIENYMIEGSVDALRINPDGIIIGAELARRVSLSRGDNITLAATTGQVKTMKIVGIFRTGRASYDENQAFADLKRVQALLNRSNRANSIIIKLPEPNQARRVASEIEAEIGYKSVSWQESSEDLMSTLAIRNTIMYTVVSAVLVVAAFGIFNVISTVVMEKQRDISILKSIGFHASDIQWIFLIQGVLLGIVGCVLGVPLGCGIMLGLMQVHLKPPGSTEIVSLPIDWALPQFAIAIAFAMSAAMLAAWLPARKAAKVQPVDILRGS